MITFGAPANAEEACTSTSTYMGVAAVVLSPVVGLAVWFVRQLLMRYLSKIVQETARETEKAVTEGIIKPVKLAPPAKRNSAILIGLGGTGKTTLIRSLLHDPKADPEIKTLDYSLYHGQRSAGESWHHWYISDYRGQTIGNLVRSFVKQQKMIYSPMAYGHVNSLIVLVDIQRPKQAPSAPEPPISESPNEERMQEHLTQWSATALDAVFGFFTADTLKYVCLFINKADLLTTRNEQAVRAMFKDLEQLLRDRCGGAKFQVYVGSARDGEQVVRLEEDLMTYAVDVEQEITPPVSSSTQAPPIARQDHG
jgi:GTPase SAR1 family protein